MRNRLYILIIIVILLAVGLFALSQTRKPEQTASIGGSFQLMMHNGQQVTDDMFRGKLMLVFFGFTHCPDICPVGMQTMTTALNALGPDAKQVTPMLISVDPARDTPEQLRKFLRDFHPFILGMTGTPEQIKKAEEAYKVYSERPAQEGHGEHGDHYQVNHSAYIYLMDRDGRYITHFPHQADPQELVTAIKQAL